MKSETTDMKDEKIIGWRAQVLALYQSLVVFIFGPLSFILRLLQEYFFKMEPKYQLDEEEKSTDIGGKTKLRSAGEHKVEEGIKETEVVDPSEHTVVELMTPVPPPAVAEAAKSEGKDILVEPSGDQSKNTLVIKNLPFKFKPADLEKLLNDNHTKPKNVRLLRDESGRFSGMAFIRCPSKDEAQRLISCMNGMDIGGRTIQVEFKLKKKKKGSSCDSLSSSSDELPACRLRISNEGSDLSKLVTDTPVIQPANVAQTSSASARANKLSVSAEHTEAPQSLPLKKAMSQPRRKSTSSTGEQLHHYVNSAMPKLNLDANRLIPAGIRPVRQPIGPDGTNGFSTEYRRSRGQL